MLQRWLVDRSGSRGLVAIGDVVKDEYAAARIAATVGLGYRGDMKSIALQGNRFPGLRFVADEVVHDLASQLPTTSRFFVEKRMALSVRRHATDRNEVPVATDTASKAK